MDASAIALRVERMDGGDPVLMRDAGRLVEAFFLMDASAAGRNAYDDRVLRMAPHRVVAADIHAINATMAARSSPAWWSDVLSEEADADWLTALSLDWDLFAVGAPAWRDMVRGALGVALRHLIGPHRGLSVVTKVLHLKRPRLVPVCDDLVRSVLGAHLPEPPGCEAYQRAALAVMEHIRAQGCRNLGALQAVAAHLEARGVRPRTPARILGALLWSSHPGAWIHPLWRVLAG